ncbi:hypothetical protein Cgig2_015366 [Carnegiea gigantea]|uniref:GH16 domain-containing protein n=1 Tax=Carnegiea gigantea TaxID=171969 RepID=A0A9Q1K744_9CARY|nr:hypothetical protein Cgig2_015366 [Carnegiea gigantea]
MSMAGSAVFSYLFLLIASLFAAASAGNFYRNFDVTWGDGRGKIFNNGQMLTLSLDKASASGFQSKNEYLFGRIDMQLKLVPGNSAGTVTAYYLSSQGAAHDEIDFKFSEDGTAIREFKNFESISVPFLKSQAMRIYSSLWNADDWATQGGRVKTDWSKAPFTTSYRNFNANACIWSNGKSSYSSTSASRNNVWLAQELDTTSQARMKWV